MEVSNVPWEAAAPMSGISASLRQATGQIFNLWGKALKTWDRWNRKRYDFIVRDMVGEEMVE